MSSPDAPRGSARILDVVLWAALASGLLIAGARHLIGIPWVEIACVLAGSMLAVRAVWRAWGLRRMPVESPPPTGNRRQGRA